MLELKILNSNLFLSHFYFYFLLFFILRSGVRVNMTIVSFFLTSILYGSCYDEYLKDAIWTRAKGNDNIIGCAGVISVSASCGRHFNLALSSCIMTCLSCVLWTISSYTLHIYSVDTIMYSYALPLITILLLLFKSLLKYNLSSRLRS